MINLWVEAAQPITDGIYSQFAGGRAAGMKSRLAKETSYRHRLNRLLPQDDPRRVMGTSLSSARVAMRPLFMNGDAIIVLPNAKDTELVGPVAYPGANPPNPFQWVPVIARHTVEGDIVWEMGPGLSSSAAWVGEDMNRHVWLVQVPAPGSREHQFRTPAPFKPGATVEPNPVMPMEEGIPLADIDEKPPALVLVPLPVPLDAFSMMDFKQTHVRTARMGDGLFEIDSASEPAEQHPEFATEAGAYISTTVARLLTLDKLVCAEGTRVCVTAPMVKGTPKTVEKAIHKHIGWQVVGRIHAFERGGTTHAWNGTSLVGTAMTIWGAP